MTKIKKKMEQLSCDPSPHNPHFQTQYNQPTNRLLTILWQMNFKNILGKGKKMMVTRISFLQTFSPTYQGQILSIGHLRFVLYRCFILDNFNILSFGTELTHSLIHHVDTVPNSKKLQTTTEIWLLKGF